VIRLPSVSLANVRAMVASSCNYKQEGGSVKS